MLKLVAVCACTMGLAHTFIAAEAIEQASNELGYFIKVETQGADGIKNELNDYDIKSADIIIHATSIIPDKINRFDGYEVYEVSLQDLIRDASAVINGIVDDLNI